MIENSLIREFKDVIEKGDVDVLKSMYIHYSEFDEKVDWPYILQKTYIHACLKKKTDIASWLESLFDYMDPIQKIAYRHTLAYGRVLLNKK